MTFHDVSEFSITYVKQLFLKYGKNNLLFKVFSHIMRHRRRFNVNVVFTGIVTDLLAFLFSKSILLFHDFPGFP